MTGEEKNEGTRVKMKNVGMKGKERGVSLLYGATASQGPDPESGSGKDQETDWQTALVTWKTTGCITSDWSIIEQGGAAVPQRWSVVECVWDGPGLGVC